MVLLVCVWRWWGTKSIFPHWAMYIHYSFTPHCTWPLLAIAVTLCPWNEEVNIKYYLLRPGRRGEEGFLPLNIPSSHQPSLQFSSLSLLSPNRKIVAGEAELRLNFTSNKIIVHVGFITTLRPSPSLQSKTYN